MLPKTIRNTLFDKLSAVTMRKQFNPINLKSADGLLKEVLEQSQRDFFINGTITCHTAVPEIMAGVWLSGREIVLVNDRLPAWLKKAMGAALSEVNQCPYCEDFLLSLTYGAKEKNVADSLKKNNVDDIQDELTQKRMRWIKAAPDKNAPELMDPPFSISELPEALGTLIVFGYTNKMSDFALDGSPVPTLGRGTSLKFFGGELRESAELELKARDSFYLLPESPIPTDLEWSKGNLLVAESLARWQKVIDDNIQGVLSEKTRKIILDQLQKWEGGPPGISRGWVESEVQDVDDSEKNRAKVALIVAKYSYQIDDGLLDILVQEGLTEKELLALGSWSAYNGAKTVANWSHQAISKKN